VAAHTQMTRDERQRLRVHATGRSNALEIGTFMGVSACDIASVLAPNGMLTCVDPWPAFDGQDPCLAIARREFARHNVEHRIRLIQERSCDAEARLGEYDFIFIDGDHSEEGLATDWGVTQRHLLVGGVVCLHDTVGPLPSAIFYQRVIA